jgi:hypothetical protein
MSYDITMRVHAARAMADWTEQEHTEDLRRAEFLKRLARATEGLTPFEAQFVENFSRWLEDPQPSSRLVLAQGAFEWQTVASEDATGWFTPRRRDLCDEMRRRLGGAR